VTDAHRFLETLALVLCAAAVTTVLFQRLRQPVVLGYLLAGMVIGPYVPVPLEADPRIVRTLSELGVILLMFSLGTDFALAKLARVGSSAGLIALVECSLMAWLGYLAGQAFGWPRLECMYAGAIIAISSTTIIVKAFDEQRVQGAFKEVVFGVLIVEDLIAIVFITVLSAISSGQGLSAGQLALAVGKLVGFLALLMVAGLATVPRLMRAVVALNRAETTGVASVGLAFGFALMALALGYSVALGAFIAGSLVAESGVESKVKHQVAPIRDIFAAIFFVSVGMLIDPALIVAHLPTVLVFVGLVLVGKVCWVSLAAFLTGYDVQTAVQSGMSLAQIGEFSFIVASLGLASGATGDFLYPLAVAVSALTTLSTPWLIRAAQPVANWVDRKLPRPLQTFVALYGSWLARLRLGAPRDAGAARIYWLARWLAVDAMVVAGIIIVASLQLDELIRFASQHLAVHDDVARLAVIAAAVALSAPFWVGMLRVARFLGFELANRVFPARDARRLDLADAPRRLFIVTLQLAIVVLVGAPLIAITQPFVPLLPGAAIASLLLILLALSLWRNATNLQGHARAAAQIIIESLAEQSRDGQATQTAQATDELEEILVGLGSPVTLVLPHDSPAVGKTLAEIDLRGLSGATVLAVKRAGETVVVPAGREMLRAGDTLALAGTPEAIERARHLLLDSSDR
jgi:CPA2 family monovalent cation:H+ antiporter-2